MTVFFLLGYAFLLTDTKAMLPRGPDCLLSASVCIPPLRSGLQENAIVNMKQSQILQTVKT